MSSICLPNPCILVVGRKRWKMSKPVEVVIDQTLRPLHEDGPLVFASATLKVFVCNKLFATAILSPQKPQKPYERPSARIIKPKQGLLELRLTKRLMNFTEGVCP